MKRKPTGKLSSVAGWVVLVVDDTLDNVVVAKKALEFHGAQVYTAGNGEEGFEQLQRIRPTVILLDIRMPKMDGWAMFKAVRENPDMPRVPIIAITAYAMDSDKDEILQAGFDGYIPKPFDMFTFVEDIERIVSQTTKPQDETK